MADNETETESYKQKNVKLIENDIFLLYEKCVRCDVSNQEIKSASRQFMNQIEQQENTHYRKIIGTVLIFICLCVVLCYQPQCNRLLHVSIRHASLMVLTVWDWRWLHDIRCVWGNPLVIDEERKLEQHHCEICSGLQNIPILNSTILDEIAQEYLYEDLPVIVEITDDFMPVSLSDLIKLYLEDEEMMMYSCCDFVSNVNVPRKNHRLFLKQVQDGKHSSYFAHWQNCFMGAAKLFRQVYKRPDFLPTSVELSPTNWIFLSSRFSGTSSVKIPLEESVVILIQLSGSLHLTLKPKQLCWKQCKEVDITLRAGATLIMTDLLFNMEYHPSSDDISITVALGGSIDGWQ